MYQIESVFIGESQQDAPSPLIEQTEIINNSNNSKVGDVTRLGTNNFTLTCVQCWQSFGPNLEEFTLHVEDHFLQGDIFNSNNVGDDVIKNESRMDNFSLFDEDNGPEMLDYSSNDQFVAESGKQSGYTDNTMQNQDEGFTYKTVQVKIKNIFCPICMKGFSSVHYAQKHIKSIHKQTISADEIRNAQCTLKQIVKPKKSENLTSPEVKLNLLSSNYWRTEGKRYHCTLCVQWFSVPKYVQKHLRLVHGRHFRLEEILAAQIQPELKPEPSRHVVDITQKQMESLQREQTKYKEGQRMKSFECFACHTMFVSEKALRYHMPLHEGIQYRCPLCDKFFQMQKYVRDHMIYKHGFDKKSKLPKLKTRKIENFQYHKPVVSRFECYLCHRTYPSRSKLNSHFKSHLDILECSICTKIFKSTESRRRHLQLHSADPNLQHHCLICNKAFPVRRYLMSHMRTSHRSPKIKVEKPPKVQSYLPCLICDKVFDKKSLLNKHMKRHNKQSNSNQICDYCGDHCENLHTLRRHLSSVHKISKKYVKCKLCQKIVPKKREEEHMKLHSGKKDHQCEICGNQYVSLVQLNTHKRRQHIGSNYKCDVCPESFDQPKKFLHHRRSHTEPMTITCSICNLGFFNTRSLTKHEAKKHKKDTLEGDSDQIVS